MNTGAAVPFGYDEDGLLTQAGDLAIARDPASGRITGTTLSGITTSRTYNTFGEPEEFRTQAGTGDLFHATYTRDDLGRITLLTETEGGVTTTKAYAYDLASRLSEVRTDGVVTATYEYDRNGNRILFTGPSGTLTGTYDVQDRLLSYGDASYSYTANGELTAKIVGSDTTRYVYDVLGNLRSVSLPDGTVIEYVVDGLNRRVGKKVNGVLVQGWLYQGRLNPIAELDGAGTVVTRFVYGSRGNVPDYMTRNGETYRIVSDHLGSVRLVVNVATGAVAQKLDYDEWGNVLIDTNPGFQPFGFAGGLYDPLTGLVRFGARDYDAEVGRWTAKDPKGFGGGSENLFAYVAGNPVSRIDPTGLDWIYDRSTNMLHQTDSDGNIINSWPAGSGPFGNGPLPPGEYTLVGAPFTVSPPDYGNGAFCDAQGDCWFQRIVPNFPTDRDSLGIHPDGNIVGTRGCIGATDADAGSLRDALAADPGTLTVIN